MDLTETAKVSEMLSDTIVSRNLDAITVECFPMVQKDGVTACLPMQGSITQDPAVCEGDMTSIVGRCSVRINRYRSLDSEYNKVTMRFACFSHCTIAPAWFQITR